MDGDGQTIESDREFESTYYISHGKTATAFNDFADDESVGIDIDRGGAGPGKKGSSVYDRGFADSGNIRFVGMADEEKSRPFLKFLNKLDRLFRSLSPTLQNREGSSWGPGLAEEDLDLSPDSWIVIFHQCMLLERRVLKYLQVGIERFGRDSTGETAFHCVFQHLLIRAPWSNVVEDGIAVGDKNVSSIQLAVMSVGYSWIVISGQKKRFNVPFLQQIPEFRQ